MIAVPGTRGMCVGAEEGRVRVRLCMPQGPLPALVLSCLLHVLPAHKRWEYKRGEQRWQLSASLMQASHCYTNSTLTVCSNRHAQACTK